MNKNRYYKNKDGNRRVRWWSVYRQLWRTAYQVEDIPDEEYAAMPREEREKAIAYLQGDIEVTRP